MSDLIKYDWPYPNPTSIAADDQKCCPATASGFGCTREPGHSGDHQASGVRNQMLASWPGDAS